MEGLSIVAIKILLAGCTKLYLFIFFFWGDNKTLFMFLVAMINDDSWTRLGNLREKSFIAKK